MEELNYTVETVEEVAEEVAEEVVEEVAEATCKVKCWINNTLYEAGRLLETHKKAILTIAAVAAGVAAVVTAICLLTKKK